MRTFKNIKADILLIACIVLAGVVPAAMLCLTAEKGKTVTVSVDGTKAYEVALDKDAEYVIEGYDGGTNLLIIADGTARIESASCPDRLCVHMGRISSAGQSIICLPNRVVVEIAGEDANDKTDVIAG